MLCIECCETFQYLSFRNFLKFAPFTLSCVHVMWKVKSWFLIRVVNARTFNFPWWYLYSVGGLINIRTAFGQNCNFVFLAIFFFYRTFSLILCGEIKDKVVSFLIAVTLNSQKFDMLMYPDHLENWLDFGKRLLIFLILAAFWLSETGQICDFWAFSWEHKGGMASNLHVDVFWPPSE